MNFDKEIKIRLEDPRILLNEFFGYLSFLTGLITAFFVIFPSIGDQVLFNLGGVSFSYYSLFNQIMLASCAFQNLPLLMVYVPQWRILIALGILGIVVTNYYATHPIGQAFREGLFVGMIKVDYSYEALVKYYPEKYQPEAVRIGGRKDVYGSYEKGFLPMFFNMLAIAFEFISKFFNSSDFRAGLFAYLKTIVDETLIRSGEMLAKIMRFEWEAFIKDAVRSQFFSSLMRILSALPLFIIVIFELSSYAGFFEKTELYISQAHLWTTISIRALAFSSFIDGLSKIAFGFMRESFMMRLGGIIFAAAQLYLMFTGEHSLKLVIPLSLAGLAAYPIVEGERLRKLALEEAM